MLAKLAQPWQQKARETLGAQQMASVVGLEDACDLAVMAQAFSNEGDFPADAIPFLEELPERLELFVVV